MHSPPPPPRPRPPPPVGASSSGSSPSVWPMLIALLWLAIVAVPWLLGFSLTLLSLAPDDAPSIYWPLGLFIPVMFLSVAAVVIGSRTGRWWMFLLGVVVPPFNVAICWFAIYNFEV